MKLKSCKVLDEKSLIKKTGPGTNSTSEATAVNQKLMAWRLGVTGNKAAGQPATKGLLVHTSRSFCKCKTRKMCTMSSIK